MMAMAGTDASQSMKRWIREEFAYIQHKRDRGMSDLNEERRIREELQIHEFDGSNVNDWILEIEDSFRFFQLSEEEKLKVAILGFVGEARQWFDCEHSWLPFTKWDNLKEQVKCHFYLVTKISKAHQHSLEKPDAVAENWPVGTLTTTDFVASGKPKASCEVEPHKLLASAMGQAPTGTPNDSIDVGCSEKESLDEVQSGVVVLNGGATAEQKLAAVLNTFENKGGSIYVGRNQGGGGSEGRSGGLANRQDGGRGGWGKQQNLSNDKGGRRILGFGGGFRGGGCSTGGGNNNASTDEGSNDEIGGCSGVVAWRGVASHRSGDFASVYTGGHGGFDRKVEGSGARSHGNWVGFTGLATACGGLNGDGKWFAKGGADACGSGGGPGEIVGEKVTAKQSVGGCFGGRSCASLGAVVEVLVVGRPLADGGTKRTVAVSGRKPRSFVGSNFGLGKKEISEFSSEGKRVIVLDDELMTISSVRSHTHRVM